MLERARRKTITKLLCAVLLVGGLLVSQQASAAEDPRYPGLPAQTGQQMTGVGNVGLTEVSRAKQWVRLPPLIAAADVRTKVERNPPDEPDVSVRTTFTNLIYVVSPVGAAHRYGEMPPIIVRTVAFGAMPVEATVQISQARDAEGLPIPLSLKQIDRTRTLNGVFGRYLSDAEAAGEMNVRLTGLVADGVPVDVGSRCFTSKPGALNLVGKGYGPEVPKPVDPRIYYSGALGGRLTGTIDLPRFVGCGTGSEDLSPLVSGMVSGTGNPVKLQVSMISSNCFPKLLPICAFPDPFSFPNRED